MRIELLSALLAVGRSLQRQDLNQGAAGNLSVRWQDGFFITPSGCSLDRCRVGDLVWLSLEHPAPGKQQHPSSEWRLHRDIYLHFPEAACVLHAHAPWCTTLACMHKPIPPFHYMILVAGGATIRCAPYAPFGTQELSDRVITALQGRSACLLAHHGMVCFAASPDAALALALEVETLARIYCQMLAAGPVKLLTQEQIEEARKRFASYRKNT